MTEPFHDYSIEDKIQAECDHEEAITLCVYCGTTLDTSKEHEEYVKALKKTRVLYVKALEVRKIVETLIAEQDMLRKTLGDAYSALKVWDPLPDELGYGQGPGESGHWSLVFELFHNIEIALGIDEEE